MNKLLFQFIVILLLPTVIFAQDEPTEADTEINTPVVATVTNLKTLSASIVANAAASIHNTIPRVDYSSVVEFNKVHHNGCSEPSITQVIFWERIQKTVEIDLTFCILHYADYTKTGILDYYIVKDWRMISTMIDMDIEEIGEGQHRMDFIDGGKTRRVYFGRAIFTQTSNDPERDNIRIVPSENRTLLTR